MVYRVAFPRTPLKSYPQATSDYPLPIPCLSTLKSDLFRYYPQIYPHYAQLFYIPTVLMSYHIWRTPLPTPEGAHKVYRSPNISFPDSQVQYAVFGLGYNNT
jgi:hypothetical protein